VYDDGPREERSGGERDDSALDQEAAQSNAAATGREFADPLPGGPLTGSGDPRKQRWRRECRDGRAQRDASAIEQPPDGAVAQPKGARNLFVAVAGDGGAEDDLALHPRQRGDAHERLSCGQPAFEICVACGGAPGCRLGRALGLGGDLATLAGGAAHDIDGGVVHDAVEPGAQIAHLGAAAQRRPGLHERLLHNVLGAGLREGHAPAVAQQRSTVAEHERLEGTIVTGTHERREPLVGLCGQQTCGCLRTHSDRCLSPTPRLRLSRAKGVSDH
jgi:hypothetical protein